MEQYKAIIEAMLFVSGTPVTIKKMKEVLEDTGDQDIRSAVDELMREYGERKGGVRLVEVAGGFQFRTDETLAPWLKKFAGVKPATLSQAAMETLAVVAYRQPIMKSEIDRIRGVDASTSLRSLLERNLIRIMGRKDVPGRPILYGTSRHFLEVFSLRDLTELPTLEELKELGE